MYRRDPLTEDGHYILRFSNDEIRENLGGVHRTIVDALVTSPTQTLPHQGPIKGRAFVTNALYIMPLTGHRAATSHCAPT